MSHVKSKKFKSRRVDLRGPGPSECEGSSLGPRGLVDWEGRGGGEGGGVTLLILRTVRRDPCHKSLRSHVTKVRGGSRGGGGVVLGVSPLPLFGDPQTS